MLELGGSAKEGKPEDGVFREEQALTLVGTDVSSRSGEQALTSDRARTLLGFDQGPSPYSNGEGYRRDGLV
jgi:hypothetical protein